MLSLLVHLLALSALIPLIDSSCTAKDGPCQEGAGTCFLPVQLALSGSLLEAVAALTYGKYCGANNKCQVVENKEKKKKNPSTCQLKKKTKKKTKKGPCPAIPCDGIDSACARHDWCLDNEISRNPPPTGERVPVPQRCHCDVDFVATSALLAVQTVPTGLCDAAFYNSSISPNFPVSAIALLKHEAVLMAAPFCCDVLTDECALDAQEGGNTDSTNYATASSFCNGLIDQLKGQGVQICKS